MVRNERRLVRDLYDCNFMADILAVRPHIPTLMQRLSKSEIRSGRTTKKVSLTIADLIAALWTTLSSLSQVRGEDQMRDFLSPV